MSAPSQYTYRSFTFISSCREKITNLLKYVVFVAIKSDNLFSKHRIDIHEPGRTSNSIYINEMQSVQLDKFGIKLNNAKVLNATNKNDS